MSCRHGTAGSCAACAAWEGVRQRRGVGARPAASAAPPPASPSGGAGPPCRFRGATPLRQAPCAAGEGCGQVAVHACELHRECTTDPRRKTKGVKSCGACKDRQEAVAAWAVGVTAVPSRINTTLPGTLRTLSEAGFPTPHLFADGASDEWGTLDAATTVRPTPLGCAGNWLLSAAELLARSPAASHLLMVQDDAVFSPGLRQQLDALRWPAKAYLNLFLHPRQGKKPAAGWAPSDGWGMGAVALAFQRDCLEAVVASPALWAKLRRPGRDGWAAIDGAVCKAAQAAGWTEYVHHKSLVDHAGDESTLGHGGRGPRRGVGFIKVVPAAEGAAPAHPGGMTESQYARVVSEIVKRTPCRVLVFGAGWDTARYAGANADGSVVVLEDDAAWIDVGRRAGAEVHAVRYATKVGGGLLDDCPDLQAPEDVAAGRFDVILIDGPGGGGPSAPGRQQAAMLASRLIAPGGTVLAHDADRPHDALCYARHLGEPVETIPGPPDLAIYRR